MQHDVHLSRFFRAAHSIITLCASVVFCLAGVSAQGAVTELWTQRFSSGLGSAEDSATRVLADAAGNLIVAGATDSVLSSGDILIAKYSASRGTLLWQVRHNGPGNSSDGLGGLALDGDGNVVMVGASFGIGSGADLYTAKYAGTDGQLLWERRYNGVGNYNDWANGLAIDRDNNVVVTGRSAASSSYDIYTVKYAATDGSTLWEQSYNGASNLDDVPSAVLLDVNEDVLIVGSSGNLSNTDTEFVTVKYAAGTGTLLWERHLPGPNPRAAVMADNGDLVVTGTIGPGFSPDIHTVRYAANGSLLWEQRYNGPSNGYDEPHAMVLDPNGNVLVTGQSFDRDNSFNIYTVKYAAADGSLIWERRVGTADSDFSESIAVDSRGDVIVAGYLSSPQARFDAYTAKFAAESGVTIWEQRYDGPAHQHDYALFVTVDTQDNVAIAGGSTSLGGTSDFYTAKYEAATGSLVWEQRYDGPREKYDAASAAAIDKDGNVIVTGTVESDRSDGDVFTIKYSPTGAIVWTNRYDGPERLQDGGNAVAVDSRGDVFVTGYSVGENGPDFYTAKYAAADGALLWEQRYDGPLGSYDEGKFVAVDANGDAVVVGESYSLDPGEAAPDFYTAKYAGADGALIWERRYEGPVETDSPAGLHLDRNGNVVVTGFSIGPEGNADSYTAKYAGADGALLWERRYNGPISYGSDHGNAVALDAPGNVIVTGSSDQSLSQMNDDLYTAKYAATDGALIWEVRYDGPAGLDDEAFATAVDAEGNAIVTGYSHAQDGRQEIYTAKYRASDGALLWDKRYRGPGQFGENVGFSVALDAGGNAVISGYSNNGTNNDYYTAKYAAADGMLLWERRYNGPGLGIDTPAAQGLAVGPGDQIVVTGISDFDFATVVYRDNLPPVIHCPLDLAVDFSDAIAATVSFDVRGTDGSGAPPSIVCVPPSGSRFPIGSTPVHCMAMDVDGLSARCSFAVTVRGARSVIADVSAALVAAKESAAARERRSLERAVTELTQALSAELWRDETHLSAAGGDVFRAISQAARALCSLDQSASVDRLTSASRLLAAVAIHEAPGAAKIDQAHRALTRGDDGTEGRSCGQSIDDYRSAWELANRPSPPVNRDARK